MHQQSLQIESLKILTQWSQKLEKSGKSNCQKGIDLHVKLMMCHVQIHQSQNNQFNMHVHVEYEWRLRQDDLYESDDDLDDKVTT